MVIKDYLSLINVPAFKVLIVSYKQWSLINQIGRIFLIVYMQIIIWCVYLGALFKNVYNVEVVKLLK